MRALNLSEHPLHSKAGICPIFAVADFSHKIMWYNVVSTFGFWGQTQNQDFWTFQRGPKLYSHLEMCQP